MAKRACRNRRQWKQHRFIFTPISNSRSRRSPKQSPSEDNQVAIVRLSSFWPFCKRSDNAELNAYRLAPWNAHRGRTATKQSLARGADNLLERAHMVLEGGSAFMRR